MKRNTILLVVLGALVLFGIISFNGMVGANNLVESQWGNVENAYQLRADKTKNLFQIVKGAANFEQETLEKVIAARSQATSIKLDAKDLTPENMAKFQAAQDGFGSALSKLMVVVERYPDLKAVQAFRDFQAQYEGMENRIGVERRKFNEVAKDFNNRIQKLPGKLFNMMFGFAEKGYFKAAEGAENAPDIDFTK